jgi:membrane protein
MSTASDRPSLVSRARAAFARVQRTRAWRANARFGRAGGGVLTGGIAYATLFGAAAALTVGWSILMATLGRDAGLRGRVLDALDQSLPGIVDTGDGRGLVDPEQLRLSPALTVSGIVALVVLVVSAVNALAALRTGLRAMFGAPPTAGNAAIAQLRSLAGLAGLGLAVLLSAVLTVAATSAADWLLGVLLGDQGGWLVGALVRAAGLLVAFLVDAATFVLMIRVLAAQDPPRRDLLGGAAIAGVGMGVVRFLGTSVVAGSADRNAVLASVAVVATLLVWVNLMARIVLLAAAWTADPPLEEDSEEDAGGVAGAGDGEHPEEDRGRDAQGDDGARPTGEPRAVGRGA